VVAALASVGNRGPDTETDCAEMVFGLLPFGKLPTLWSGKPLAVSERRVLLHVQVAVAVAFTEGLLLKALLL
jgi:hypothetical protein